MPKRDAAIENFAFLEPFAADSAGGGGRRGRLQRRPPLSARRQAAARARWFERLAAGHAVGRRVRPADRAPATRSSSRRPTTRVIEVRELEGRRARGGRAAGPVVALQEEVRLSAPASSTTSRRGAATWPWPSATASTPGEQGLVVPFAEKLKKNPNLAAALRRAGRLGRREPEVRPRGQGGRRREDAHPRPRLAGRHEGHQRARLPHQRIRQLHRHPAGRAGQGDRRQPRPPARSTRCSRPTASA